jgi:hypothetical protein
MRTDQTPATGHADKGVEPAHHRSPVAPAQAKSAAREHDQPDRARPGAVALAARAQAAKREAAAACEAAARAQENARRAHDRCRQLRAQNARGARTDGNACRAKTV